MSCDVISYIGRSLLQRFLQGMSVHRLVVDEYKCDTKEFGIPGGDVAHLTIKRPSKFYWRLLLRNDVGFAESYIADEIDTDNLRVLLKVLTENRDNVADYVGFTGVVSKQLDKLWYWWRDPSNQRTAKKNISEHYDLSGLFHHFLDETMTYSCGIFMKADDSLHQAQINKIQATIDTLRLAPGMRVLEIGSGWGALSCAIAEQTGCFVHGLTLSEEQLHYVEQIVRERNLQHLVTVELVDYRNHDTVELYDRIVSIEMLEAVGHSYLGAFFDTCDKFLKPDGVLFTQVITMPDQRYEAYRVRPEFINQHIFPAACCPSLQALVNAASNSSFFVVESLENIGPHYAPTLSLWAERFQSAFGSIQKENPKYDQAFFRKWMYYFRYCEVGFQTRTLGNLRIVWTRANNQLFKLAF